LTAIERRVIVDLCHLNLVPQWVSPVIGGSSLGLRHLVERQRLFSGLDTLAREFGFDD